MTVDTTIRKKIYLGNANQTEFAIPFVYIKDSDIRAVRTRADGTDVQILDNFSISHPSGGWAVFNYPLVGTPLEFGESLTIYRVTDTRQLTDLLNGGDFNADVIELALDQITMMVQDLAEEMGRVPVIPISESADFDEMIQNILIAEAQIAADRKFIEEMAGTFESATETQRGVGYVASDAEAESYTTTPRDPAGPAFLDPERGEKLARSIIAEYGLDSAAIDRLGTVRIAKQSEVTNGVTETGRSPAVVRPEEHAAAHAAFIKVFTESGEYIPTRDCSIRATIVDGGQGGQGGNRANVNEVAAGGAAGYAGAGVVVWIYAKKGVPISINVGDGGAGGAGLNFGSRTGIPGDVGGKSSVIINEVRYCTSDGYRGDYISNTYYPSGNSTIPGSSGTAGAAGAVGKTYSRDHLGVAGYPGSGGGTGNDLGGAGGAGGTGGVLLFTLFGTDFNNVSSAAGGKGSRGWYGGTGASGWGAGGGGGGAVSSSSSGQYGGSGGKGAPGVVVFEIFFGGKSNESDV